jgi:hypothetical protein
MLLAEYQTEILATVRRGVRREWRGRDPAGFTANKDRHAGDADCWPGKGTT